MRVALLEIAMHVKPFDGPAHHAPVPLHHPDRFLSDDEGRRVARAILAQRASVRKDPKPPVPTSLPVRVNYHPDTDGARLVRPIGPAPRPARGLPEHGPGRFGRSSPKGETYGRAPSPPRNGVKGKDRTFAEWEPETVTRSVKVHYHPDQPAMREAQPGLYPNDERIDVAHPVTIEAFRFARPAPTGPTLPPDADALARCDAALLARADNPDRVRAKLAALRAR